MKNNVIPYPRMPEGATVSSGGKHFRYLNVLSKVAADIVRPAKTNARVSAAIVYKNDIVAFGINERKSHPFQVKFGKNEDAVYLHAETDAIKNALRYITVDELERSTLYICRIKFTDTYRRSMTFGLSKPCSGCERCIQTFGIRNVIYTLDGNSYSVL